MSGKGLPFIGKLNEFITKVLHPTVQKVGNSRAALDTLNRGYFLIQTAAFVVEAGSTDELLVITGHPFKEGDGIRIQTSANPIKEIEIVIDQVIDANTVKFAGYLSASLSAGDLVYGRRPITETFASDGTALATLSYLRDGISVPVARDTLVEANTTALPVEIMGANGMVLNVTTGDIDVQMGHADRVVNGITVVGDSIKIGNGLVGAAARFLSIVTNATSGLFEAQVKDQDVLDSLGLDITTPTAMPTGGVGVRGWLSAIWTKLNGTLAVNVITGFATDTNQTNGSQQAQIKTPVMGITPAGIVTSSIVDADHQALDVVVRNSGTQTIPVTGSFYPATQNVAINGLTEDRDTGAAGTSTLRVVLANKHDAAITPLSVKLSDGVDFINSLAIFTTQFITGSIAKVIGSASIMMGWDGTNHREILLGSTGKVEVNASQLPSGLGTQGIANSLPINPATNSVFTTVQKAITTTYAENLAITTQVAMAAPIGAIGCIIMTDDVNANNLRVVQNGTASLTSGMPLQAGRDIQFKSGQNLSFISDNNGVAGAAVKVYVQWYIQS